MELEIINDYNAGRVVIYCWDELPGFGMRFISFNGESIERTDVEDMPTRDSKGAKPLLVLPARMAPEIFKLLAAAFSKQNINTENENLLKGKMEAMESHLSDMRSLTKLFASQLKPIDPGLKDAWVKYLNKQG